MRNVNIAALSVLLGIVLTPAVAAAAEGAQASEGILSTKAVGALAIGIAALGAALGQGRTAAAALEGIGRNPGASPRIQTSLVLSLALVESILLIAVVGIRLL